MAKEKLLDTKVMAYIKDRGGWCIKYWAGARYTKTGIPDILACVNGYFVAIEDKAERGKPSMLQLVNLKKIRDTGGYGILLYPSDFDNFKAFVSALNAYGKLPQQQVEWYEGNLILQRRWKERLQ